MTQAVKFAKLAGDSRIEEMENAILKLLKNEDLCEEIAQKGWEFVQKFNDNVIATQLILVYNRIKNE